MTEQVTIKIETNPKFKPLQLFTWIASQVLVIGVGIYAESEAMQWAGFVFLCIIFACMMIVIAQKSEEKPLTIEQARARLDEIERGDG